MDCTLCTMKNENNEVKIVPREATIVDLCEICYWTHKAFNLKEDLKELEDKIIRMKQEAELYQKFKEICLREGAKGRRKYHKLVKMKRY